LLKPLLSDLIRRTRGKFFLSAFSSHLHRIRQVAEAAHEAGRCVVPLGRRIAESVRLGIEIGQLDFPPGTFISSAEADFVEPRRLAMLASGSQGEPLSALTKLAADSHPAVHVAQGDVIVLSSRSIPGNERAIHTLINQLFKRGAEVLYDGIAPVHVSGHAFREELSTLVKLTRPHHFVPIHGEYRHLVHHIRVAIQAGLPAQNCILLEDGDPLVLAGGTVKRTRPVYVGRLIEEGDRLAAPSVIRERRALAHQGTVLVVLAVSAKDGRIIVGPDLVARGVIDEAALDLARARAAVSGRLRALNGYARFDQSRVRDEIMRTLRHHFADANGSRPLIIPHIMEI
jgi:ribonuclease J